MFKKQPFIVFIFLCASYLGFGQASDLIISEYAEGSSNNKYIEIYNGTGTSVDLNDYEIWKVSNGGTWPEVIIGLSGNLVDGDVFIIANSSSNATILAEADLTMGSADWNGNDAVGLAKSGVLIDVIGTDGADPGTGWDVAGTANSTANHTLVRKNTICDPNTNWTISAGTNTTDSEWEVYSQDDWTYLGLHTAFCSSTDEVDWCDLQSPATGTITYGGVYNVYAQAYEPGVTDSAGQGAGIQAWIGYSTTNTNPNTWTDWVVASYNTDVGNNDEYVADIGSVIPTSGTYYYASRFQYNGGPYRYGGITPPNGGNFWDGSTYISGVLTVNPDQVDFCNVQYPKSYGITTGSSFYVYAQTYELGVTDSAGQGAGIQAW
ncbi:MAG TPA: lamin tail domain-containing protein, partial [Flavobacteriaceae bacterium]|nr:lamin tail domain-containing protein [Flavobacteriaceae bacterium]